MKLLRMKSSLAGRFPNHPQSASTEGGQLTHSGERGTAAGVAALDPFLLRDPRWCDVCQREEEFREMFTDGYRRFGFCLGCGDERVIPFSRMNSEAC